MKDQKQISTSNGAEFATFDTQLKRSMFFGDGHYGVARSVCADLMMLSGSILSI